jgi:hypothetical protein
MALGTTFSTLVEQLRAEIGASTNVGQGVNNLPSLQQTLRRNQERLWAEFNWPHLFIDRDEQLYAGQRYYSFNDDLDYTRIVGAWVKYANSFEPVGYGFNPTIYSAVNSETGSKSDPVQLWRHYEGNQYEVWPVPSGQTAQVLRYRAIKKLAPLLANSDKADLDDILIVLFSAAEILARLKAADAQGKLQLAQSHYRNLRANTMKRDMFIMGNGLPRDDRGDWVIRVNPI